MQSKFMTKAVLLVSTFATVATAFPAAAQDYGQGGYNQQQPPPGYNDGPPPGYDPNQQPPPGYDPNQPPPPGNNGYNNGGYNNGGQQGGYYDNQPPPDAYTNGGPPPPPGYDGGGPDPQQLQQDQQYASYAQQWAQANCVKSQGNVAAGAVVGGIFGAIVGGIADRRNPGRGAAVGAGIGGLGGAVAGASEDGATSPGCPPGYVVRNGAPPFYFGGGPYYYAAPAGYNPWFFYEGRWAYRPYPYHNWYYRHYHGGAGYHHRHY